MGAWIGYDKDWSFGPVHAVRRRGWKAARSFPSNRVTSRARWTCTALQVSVCGVGIGLGVDAAVGAGVFDPLLIVASVSVKVDLPWPLPDFEHTWAIEWGPQPDPPALPAPLKEISIEHLKVTTSWPLPAGQLLLPETPGPDAGMFDDQPPAPVSADKPPPNRCAHRAPRRAAACDVRTAGARRRACRRQSLSGEP